MLSYYAFYTIKDIKIVAISTDSVFFDKFISFKLAAIREVLYLNLKLNTYLNVDEYGDYITWTLHICDRLEPELEEEYLRSIIALYTRFGGIYLDPMESLEARYLSDEIILEDR